MHSERLRPNCLFPQSEHYPTQRPREPLCLIFSPPYIALLLLSVLGTMPVLRCFSPLTRANFCLPASPSSRWHEHESHDLWMHVRGGQNKTVVSFLNGWTFASLLRFICELCVTESCKSIVEQCTGPGKRMVPRLREFFRQGLAGVVSNSKNKILTTWEPFFLPIPV